MDGSQGGIERSPASEPGRRCGASCRTIRNSCTGDDGLLDELGLKVAAGNVVEFGPAALARVHAAHQREATAAPAAGGDRPRQLLRPGPDPRRGASTCWTRATTPTSPAASTSLAQQRFGLAAGVIALETEGHPPAGWKHAGRGPGGHDPGRRAAAGAHGLRADGARPVRRRGRGRSSRWPWSAWPSGSRRARACWPSARPTRRASPRTWAPSWWPSSPAWSSARPSDGRFSEPPPVTAREALALWLEHLANERRSSPRTLRGLRLRRRPLHRLPEQHRGEAI